IVATVPPCSAGDTASASVEQNGVWSNGFPFYVPPPVLSSVTPSSGDAGTQVTVTGSGFCSLQGSGQVQLGTLYATVNSWSDTQIIATVASGSTNGLCAGFQRRSRQQQYLFQHESSICKHYWHQPNIHDCWRPSNSYGIGIWRNSG